MFRGRYSKWYTRNSWGTKRCPCRCCPQRHPESPAASARTSARTGCGTHWAGCKGSSRLRICNERQLGRVTNQRRKSLWTLNSCHSWWPTGSLRPYHGMSVHHNRVMNYWDRVSEWVSECHREGSSPSPWSRFTSNDEGRNIQIFGVNFNYSFFTHRQGRLITNNGIWARRGESRGGWGISCDNTRPTGCMG